MENEELECFASAFKITPYVVFEVRYNHVGSNQEADFATSAEMLNRRKSDYTQGGQCQDDVLPQGSPALAFYQKWDSKHLSTLNEEEYNEMKADLQELQSKYPNIYKVGNDDIRFSEVVELSKQKSMKESKLEEDSDMEKREDDLRDMIYSWCDGDSDDTRYRDAGELIDEYTDIVLNSESLENFGYTEEDYDEIRDIVSDVIDAYIEEHGDIYTMAEEFNGDGSTDYLDDIDWQEIFENAPETYKQALDARAGFVRDSWGEIPDLVWNELMENVDEQLGFINYSPMAVIDNVIINGSYGDFDDFKDENESDEDFIAREEDNCYRIFPEERFIIYSLYI